MNIALISNEIHLNDFCSAEGVTINQIMTNDTALAMVLRDMALLYPSGILNSFVTVPYERAKFEWVSISTTKMI